MIACLVCVPAAEGLKRCQSTMDRNLESLICGLRGCCTVKFRVHSSCCPTPEKRRTCLHTPNSVREKAFAFAASNSRTCVFIIHECMAQDALNGKYVESLSYMVYGVCCMYPGMRHTMVRVCILLFDWDANTWWISIEWKRIKYFFSRILRSTHTRIHRANSCIMFIPSRLVFAVRAITRVLFARAEQFHVLLWSLSRSMYSSQAQHFFCELLLCECECECERTRRTFLFFFFHSLLIFFFEHFIVFRLSPRTYCTLFFIVRCSLFCVHNKTLTLWRAFCLYSTSSAFASSFFLFDCTQLPSPVHCAMLDALFSLRIPRPSAFASDSRPIFARTLNSARNFY